MRKGSDGGGVTERRVIERKVMSEARVRKEGVMEGREDKEVRVRKE